jgi:hypothetical protein
VTALLLEDSGIDFGVALSVLQSLTSLAKSSQDESCRRQ